MKKTMMIALFASLLPLAAFADDAVDAAAAPPTCKKPLLPSTNIRRADDTSDFNEKFAAYQECIKAYVDSQNKFANAHVAAANKAVEEANAFVVEINAKLSAPK